MRIIVSERAERANNILIRRPVHARARRKLPATVLSLSQCSLCLALTWPQLQTRPAHNQSAGDAHAPEHWERAPGGGGRVTEVLGDRYEPPERMWEAMSTDSVIGNAAERETLDDDILQD
ncbi:hypothetical protein NDU88_001275 [Pleurodeles waltl]|uniref:Uncharacterized protein n=1 Tax=Pleurodeles waltl TaxID=8319 RepID=A0AAV7P3E6_PLEWA|nr:hypothetical protein NDU88_001275 [Pleurodeles waltl]